MFSSERCGGGSLLGSRAARRRASSCRWEAVCRRTSSWQLFWLRSSSCSCSSPARWLISWRSLRSRSERLSLYWRRSSFVFSFSRLRDSSTVLSFFNTAFRSGGDVLDGIAQWISLSLGTFSTLMRGDWLGCSLTSTRDSVTWLTEFSASWQTKDVPVSRNRGSCCMLLEFRMSSCKEKKVTRSYREKGIAGNFLNSRNLIPYWIKMCYYRNYWIMQQNK